MFSDRLNFLMDITKAQNSVLANAVSLDASHISRLRHGGRKLPKKQSYLMPMAAFFARNLKADYQRKAVKDALALMEWPSDENATARLIYAWLLESGEERGPVRQILQTVSAPMPTLPAMPPLCEEALDSHFYYYGVAGKRQAVIRFLRAVLRESAPQTLLLYSEEEMGWLYEDRAFAATWAQLLRAVLLRGNRIRVIHTISRNMNELLEAVNKWIPIYMSGMIEPYYYPKLRDGLFQRTLFLAPQTCAVVSTSTKQEVSDTLHFYVEDPVALQALGKDFNRYLALCRPLMQVFIQSNSLQFWRLFREFQQAQGETIFLHPSLSLMSMPEAVAQSMARRATGSLLLEQSASEREAFFASIDHTPFTELITLPAPEELLQDVLPFLWTDAIQAPDLAYTKEEYRLHLENILRLLERHTNYHVQLCSGWNPSLVLYGKDGVGMMLAKTEKPITLFAFNEPNMTAAFWDYLTAMKSRAEGDKSHAIQTIRNLVRLLGNPF
ncbi:MAG: hypothetical protein EOM66_05235 [Clostridia bacterium]|nr:hypothetical protein [Clostridia bacterium]